MPLPENASMSFRGKQARWFAPVIGFFDLESLIVPVEGCQQDPKLSSTRSIEKHLPCSYALLCIEKDKVDPYFFEIQQGPDIMKSFVESVQALAKKIYIDKVRRCLFLKNYLIFSSLSTGQSSAMGATWWADKSRPVSST